jgi:hypothetical protein
MNPFAKAAFAVVTVTFNVRIVIFTIGGRDSLIHMRTAFKGTTEIR